jgi:hypothetical protein
LRTLALLPLFAAGCVSYADWRIDVSHLAEETPDGLFVADITDAGSVLQRVVIDLSTDDPQLLVPGAFQIGDPFGIVAFFDRNANGSCNFPPEDYGWIFVWESNTRDGFDWAPEVDLGDNVEACLWFDAVELDFVPFARDPAAPPR